MCYTAYTGEGKTRVALTSISTEDFVNNHWSWTKPILISPPGVDDKDACIFPGKYNGKYIIFHRIDDNIVIDYRVSLEFGVDDWLQIHSYISPTDMPWESEKVGISGTPLETEYGWLLFYHGVSKIDHQYRVGAMLLDPHNPAHILEKTKYPYLSRSCHLKSMVWLIMLFFLVVR